MNEVFRFFEEIVKIPRGSGNEGAISEYLVHFAQLKGFRYHRDSYHNVLIVKPASQGACLEGGPVILQGHMDMVCEKNQDTDFDFMKDSIQAYVDGDFYKARGTTLGADNGIALAMILAVLDNDSLIHPEIEAFFTADEEAGMTGALHFDYSLLKGKRLINLDSEEEGVFCVSCAGGCRCEIEFPAFYQKAEAGLVPVAVQVRGLRGGHSGMEIHKGYANANLLLGRILSCLFELTPFGLPTLKEEPLSGGIFLAEINGGLKENAIAREAEAKLMIHPAMLSQVKAMLEQLSKSFQKEYDLTEPELRLELESLETGFDRVLTLPLTKRIVTGLLLIPSGVLNMSAHIEGLVESSNNIGVVRTGEKWIKYTCSLRSSVPTRKAFIKEKICLLGESLGANVRFYADYPAWTFDPGSKLRETACKTYFELFGKVPSVSAIHAGLECGVFSEQKSLDMLSFGPNLWHVHTPDEKVSISSVERMTGFLIKLLERL